jgi:anti-sigma B factor antagonist
MKIQSRDDQTLEVRGILELDASNAGRVRDEIRAAITPAHTVLEIDFSAITFLDSSGLGALIALHKTLRSQNGTLRLVNPTPSASQIIELTRLHRVFEIVTR